MQFWIDKEQEKKPDAEWKDAYVFSINRKKYSTIFTNITDSWYRMDQLQISTIYEDLFIIGLSIFALDKRVSRRKFKDCWTREISVSIPVLEYEKWKHTELQWENILGFLTGDHWHITFRKSEIIYSYKEHQKIYDGINERKQYTLCMTNSPGVYISCKRIYPETKYLKFALGFHPQDVSLKDADFYDFMQLVNTTNYVGEIGLDFSRQSYISSNKQCMYFEQIVRACAEKDKLMSVHLRRAEEEAISILKKYRPRRCIIHWFNGNGEQLQQLVDIGCYFSLNSNMVTNEKNKEKLYLIPKTRVLIESDGPFTKIDGKKYTFNNLIKIYELVARYYNEPDIIKMVYANFRDILSK